MREEYEAEIEIRLTTTAVFDAENPQSAWVRAMAIANNICKKPNALAAMKKEPDILSVGPVIEPGIKNIT